MRFLMSMLFFLCSLSLQSAFAIPHQLTQQGRILDSDGVPLEGLQSIAFRLYNDPFSGSLIWNETQNIQMNNGFYSVILGGDINNNPLQDDMLQDNILYLEIEIDNSGPLNPRKPIHATPYARISKKAESVEGGSINASDIQVNGVSIVDSNGSWVGPAISVSWNNLSDIPSDIADGDDDTLATITNCSAGELLGWNGSNWTCVSDNTLTEAEVENFISNGSINLAQNSQVGGNRILTTADQGASLEDLSCLDNQIPRYNQISLQWECGDDSDLVLSDSDVDTYVENAPLNLADGTTINGNAILSSADASLQNTTCSEGEVLTFKNNTWTCTTIQSLFDADEDGIQTWDDCNDADANAGSKVGDNDCDGIAFANDCNDFDPNSEIKANDNDCDGVLTEDDCDDSDVNSTKKIEDVDCDGALTEDDCDDNDATAQTMGESNSCPAISCLEIYNAGESQGDGLYWLDPTGSDPNNSFEAYCYMEGDWPGATLVVTTPGSFSPELHSDARGGTPMHNSSSYIKFSDSRINALKNTSNSVNPYISRATKSNFGGGQGSYCVGFIRKSCNFTMGGAAGGGCENSWISQESTTYCGRNQTTSSYRGFDGHNCSNSNGSNAWGSYSHATNQFLIFEHSGGTHYCGGWDTTWSKIELLIR